MFVWRVRVLAGLIMTVLAGCSEPPAWQATAKLLSKAGPLCTDSLARGLTVTPAPGSVKGPAIVLGQLDYRQVEDKYFDDSQKLTDWFPTNTDIVRAYAKKVGSVQAAVCIRHAFIQIGIYRSDDVAAVREDWDVRVLRWPGGEVLAGKDFPGQKPAPRVEIAGGRHIKAYYAPASGQDATRWLNELIQ